MFKIRVSTSCAGKFNNDVLVNSDQISKHLADLIKAAEVDEIVTVEVDSGFTRLFSFNYLGVLETATGFSIQECHENLPPLLESRDQNGNGLYSHPAIKGFFLIWGGVWLPPHGYQWHSTVFTGHSAF